MRQLRILLAIVLTSFVAAVPANAQIIGFKIGPTFSDIDIEDDEGGAQNKLTSFGGGGFVRFGFAGLALQAEVLAVTKGTKFDDLVGDDDLDLKLDYIEIPLTAMFSFGAPYVFGGGAVAFEIDCEEDLGDVSVSCDEDDPASDTFDRKGTDFGLVGGAGLEFPVGPGNLLIEGRYTHGLSNLNEDGDNSIRNRYFAVFAGYSIPLGGF